MKKNRGNSGYIGSDQRTTRNGLVDFDKYYLERKIGRFEPILSFTGLLSVYPGAAAAYSLRLLDNFYQGYAIKVRRASDNAEQDIGFTVNNLDISTLETFCSGTDGYVTTWYDQSGNGNDATQTTSANQPQIVSAGSTILDNGKPAIQFDGSNDYINLDNSIITNPSIDDYKSVINVLSVDNTASDYTIYNLVYNSTQNMSLSYDRNNSNSIQSRYYDGTTVNDTSNLISQPQNLVSQFFRDSTLQNNSYLNTSLFNDTLSARSHALDGNNIGRGFSIVNYFKGKYQEMIIYNSDQSSNRTGIESNINNYYNII